MASSKEHDIELFTLPCLPSCCAIDCLLHQPECESLATKIKITRVSLTNESGAPVFSHLFSLTRVKSIPGLYIDKKHVSQPRAIMRHLASEVDSKLYPRGDLLQRTLIDDQLEFDSSVLYPSVSKFCSYDLFHADPPTSYERETLEECIRGLDDHLAMRNFITGVFPSLADISVGSTLTYLDCSSFDLSQYTAVNQWMDRLAQLPHFLESLKALRNWIEQSRDLVRSSNSIKRFRRLSMYSSTSSLA